MEQTDLLEVNEQELVAEQLHLQEVAKVIRNGYASPICDHIDDNFHFLSLGGSSFVYEHSDMPKIVIKFDYLNTLTSKTISGLFKKFNNLHEAGHAIEILWYHSENDEEIIDAGEVFAAKLDLPFIFIPS